MAQTHTEQPHCGNCYLLWWLLSCDAICSSVLFACFCSIFEEPNKRSVGRDQVLGVEARAVRMKRRSGAM